MTYADDVKRRDRPRNAIAVWGVPFDPQPLPPEMQIRSWLEVGEPTRLLSCSPSRSETAECPQEIVMAGVAEVKKISFDRLEAALIEELHLMLDWTPCQSVVELSGHSIAVSVWNRLVDQRGIGQSSVLG